ncbi:sarcosine oxidase subunit delta [Sulfitobacter donghicola]|uniref:Sarcosine oxidase subunit delta n=1 Tax=Sulfitobacter donghicola DSW-25 = KCTC 12864 = JCM 14565 TaxID=1300350 RepID=A0A073IG11_9RHOB|nr:sarcosine oxidase subunit delta [Sulfitobacter donghicola]KEJ89278.1 sarcosine oxidase subunit delta [Sulfitobacter donghicola DSW-25 = KCTC 12864 = JCM 14565]KIN69079.1 Sarcosine oxidase, delta subunit [Sulfitobacter donghicola DSW-25 = KCTC 12864 = JCM 14565]
MRLQCPICGLRDQREFYYKGAVLERPNPDAGPEAWDDYLHLRDNPAGPTQEYWHHEGGCGAWLVVTRDTVTHTVLDTALAADVKLGENT